MKTAHIIVAIRFLSIAFLFIALFQAFASFWGGGRFITDSVVLIVILAVLLQIWAEHLEER